MNAWGNSWGTAWGSSFGEGVTVPDIDGTASVNDAPFASPTLRNAGRITMSERAYATAAVEDGEA